MAKQGQTVSRELVESTVQKLASELIAAKSAERVAERELLLAKHGGLTPIEVEKLAIVARKARAEVRRVSRELVLLKEALA